MAKCTIEEHRFILEFLKYADEEELADLIYWRTNDEFAPCTFFVLANDLFFWGSADGEPITAETLPILKKAIDDCKAIDNVCGCIDGCLLYACRVRKERPQGASYPSDRRLWPLFDACGPEKETGFGNPYKPGEYKSNS
jgi:hypothetical protein